MKKSYFLDEEGLVKIKELRRKGELDMAKKILVSVEQSPATCDQFRLITSAEAKKAKREGDWKSVIKFLEEYIQHAKRWEAFCLRTAKQAPPEHTETDKKLLQQAYDEIRK